MRLVLPSIILIVSVFGTACDNKIVYRSADFEFKTTDREYNIINLHVSVRYQIKSRLDRKLSKKYGRNYKDILIQPIIFSISEKVLRDYSAIEIYDYNREEIEQKLKEQTKSTFSKSDFELTDFFIGSVKLPDTLMGRLRKEHIARFQEAMNNCTKETKGVVTEIHDMGSYDDLVYYEFSIDKKKYKGILNKEDIVNKLSIGDSVAIKYACENPIFHKIEKNKRK
jgi:hypothetical protein